VSIGDRGKKNQNIIMTSMSLIQYELNVKRSILPDSFSNAMLINVLCYQAYSMSIY